MEDSRPSQHQAYHLPNGTIYRDRAEAVYPLIPAGSVSMIHSDGPYGLDMAAWDRVRDLAAWYRPHIKAWGRVCKPAASVYLWNTAQGWAAIHPEMLAAGWTFRCLITWNKGVVFLQAMHCNLDALRGWKNVTEVCGFYQREGIAPYDYAGSIPDDRNLIRAWLNEERKRAGLNGRQLRAAIGLVGGKGEMVCRHAFVPSQWTLPTFDQWRALHQAWNLHGDPAGRPYLQRERGRTYDLSLAAEYEAIRAEYEAIRAEYEAIRAEYEASAEYEAIRAEYEAIRCPFTMPGQITNVWGAPRITGKERLIGSDGKVLHPCQKPLLFAERMIRASTRPGELILEPFAGTCRIAAAAEDMAQKRAEDARRYVCVEMDEDGREYVPAVMAALRGVRAVARKSHAKRTLPTGQLALFAISV